MNRKKRYICTGAVLLLLAACVSAALYVPQTVMRWYEEQAFGHVSYEEISYEPYEIRYYESFEEKLDAIAKRKNQGVQTYSMSISERTDNISDENLIDIANEEAKKLYEAGLLPEEIHIRALLGRSFHELYEISDKELSADKSESLRNIYFWKLECVTDYGTLVLDMDTEYHMIYTFALHQEPYGENSGSWETWIKPYMDADRANVAQGWIDYWGLTGAKEQTLIYDAQTGEDEKKADGLKQWTGDAALRIHIDLPSESTVILSVSLYGYYKMGWGIHWSMFDYTFD